MPHRVLVTNKKLKTLRNYNIYVTNNKAPTSWSINPLSSYTTDICRCNMIVVVRGIIRLIQGGWIGWPAI